MSDVVHSISSRHKLEQFSREREREKRREEKRREEKRREEKRREKRREEKRREKRREMEHFAKRIVPECRRATRRFQGMEGFVELRHFHKHFFKNISKNYTATF